MALGMIVSPYPVLQLTNLLLQLLYLVFQLLDTLLRGLCARDADLSAIEASCGLPILHQT